MSWLIEYLHKTRNIEEFWATTAPENKRSIALLLRTGFLEHDILERDVLSFDPGDLIFKRLK